MTALAPSPSLQRLWQSLPRAALGNLAAKLLMVLLGLGITVLVARQGPKVQGAFALFVAAESGMLTLFSGLGLWLARRVSVQQARDAQAAPVRPALLSVLRACLGLGLLASVVLLGVALGADRPPYSQLWLLALGAPFLLLVPTATGLWLGQGRMWPINLAQVASPASVLVGMGLLGHFLVGRQSTLSAVTLVLVAWVSGKAVVAVVTALGALRDAADHDDALERAPEADPPASHGGWPSDWKFVAVIGLTNIVSLMNFRVSLFMVEHFQGLAAAGTYSVAVTVAELLWLVSSSVTVAVYGRIGHPDRTQAAQTTLHAVRINLGVTLLAAPVLLVLAHAVLPRVLGSAYSASLSPLAWLLPGVAAYAAASSLSAFYTNHLGRPHLSGAIAGLSLLISAGAGWTLIPRMGAVGAALGTTLGYAVAIAVAYALFVREAGLSWRALWRLSP